MTSLLPSGDRNRNQVRKPCFTSPSPALRRIESIAGTALLSARYYRIGQTGIKAAGQNPCRDCICPAKTRVPRHARPRPRLVPTPSALTQSAAPACRHFPPSLERKPPDGRPRHGRASRSLAPAARAPGCAPASEVPLIRDRPRAPPQAGDKPLLCCPTGCVRARVDAQRAPAVSKSQPLCLPVPAAAWRRQQLRRLVRLRRLVPPDKVARAHAGTHTCMQTLRPAQMTTNLLSPSDLPVSSRRPSTLPLSVGLSVDVYLTLPPSVYFCL